MLVPIAKLPSLTSEVPLDKDNDTPPRPRSRAQEMAAQYYPKRVGDPPNPPMLLPALAVAFASRAGEDARPPNILAPIAPKAPMAIMNAAPAEANTPEPSRLLAPPAPVERISSESQTDEHYDPPKAITIPGNNQYTPGVHRLSQPGTPQPAGPSDATKPQRSRPHVCLTCQRTFARREHLNRHELSHTKEKPFECSECSRCFSRRDLLLRHKQKLHLTNPYVRPRDRVKTGDGPDEGDEHAMAPSAHMGGNDRPHTPMAVHPSGRAQQGDDFGPGSGRHTQDDVRPEVSQMAMAHMRPQLPIPHAAQGGGKSQPPGSAASLYYQKQDIDLSQFDLSRFRSLARSTRPPGVAPHGGPPPRALCGPSPQGAPIPASPHQIQREPPRHVETSRPVGPPMPVNYDTEESGFHIPFAKRSRRDSVGRSRQAQASRYQQQHQHGSPMAPVGPPLNGIQTQGNFEPQPMHSLLDQLAIAAVPDDSGSLNQRYEEGLPLAQHIGMQEPRPEVHREEIWRSPGGTHRVVQFDSQDPRPKEGDVAVTESLAPPAVSDQTRSPSRKRSLQEDKKEEGEGMKMQGGFRRSMRRALSMSMEDDQRSVILTSPPDLLLETQRTKGKKATTEQMEMEETEKEGQAKPNVRYIKAATSRLNLREEKGVSPVRGRKPSAKAKETEAQKNEPEKRGRGRPPKSAAATAPSIAKGKKAAKQEEPGSQSEEKDEDEEEDEPVVQLLQEEKRTRLGLREAKKAKKIKGEETLSRTFRSVRLQAKHMK